VQKTKEQEESVSIGEGFNASVPRKNEIPIGGDDGASANASEAHLLPRVVCGETRQGVISGENIPERKVEQNVRRTVTKMALGNQLKCVSAGLLCQYRD
jgi:hypothetical protein